jgi:peptidoglycan lytic transglycosylase
MMRTGFAGVLCLSLLAMAAVGCREPALPPPRTETAPRGRYTQTGEASYYADKFNGRKTASGQRYSHRKLTAAHRTLPFGSMVKVTNLNNRRRVTVRINDRGPWKRGRIIDLSRAAAEKLDMIRAGVARVRIDVLR